MPENIPNEQMSKDIIKDQAAINEQLRIAAIEGNLEQTAICIKAGANINYVSDRFGRTPWTIRQLKSPLQAAIVCGHERVADYLLAQGADINLGIFLENTLLHAAVADCKLDIAKWALAKGARVNQPGSNNKTPIFYVSSAEMLQLLWDNHADITHQDANGNTPLFAAVVALFQQRVQLFVEQGIEGLSIESMNEAGYTCLHWLFAKANSRDAVSKLAVGKLAAYLINSGANINTTNQAGCSLLETVFNSEAPHEYVKLLPLSQLRFDVDEQGNTSMHRMVMQAKLTQQQIDAYIYLLQQENNAVVAALTHNKAGKTVTGICEELRHVKLVNVVANIYNERLLKAAASGNLAEVIANIAAGANVNYIRQKNTPLRAALAGNHEAVADYLVENDADINLAISGKDTLLHLAVRYEKFAEAQLALKKGAAVNQVGYRGRTPIFWVGSAEMLSLLLDHGARPNCKDEDNKRPIEIVIETNMYKNIAPVIDILLSKIKRLEETTLLHTLCEARGDYDKLAEEIIAKWPLEALNAADEKGNTPLQLATKAGNKNIIEFLKKRGASMENLTIAAEPQNKLVTTQWNNIIQSPKEEISVATVNPERGEPTEKLALLPQVGKQPSHSKDKRCRIS